MTVAQLPADGSAKLLDVGQVAALLNCSARHIYPCDGTKLGVATNHRGPVANRLAALDSIRVAQDGDDGINAVFDLADFRTVAAIMKPKTQRTLSPEHKARLMAAGRNARFKRGSKDAGADPKSHELRGPVSSGPSPRSVTENDGDKPCNCWSPTNDSSSFASTNKTGGASWPPASKLKP